MTPPAADRKRRPWLWLAAAMVVMAGLAFSAWRFWPQKPPAPPLADPVAAAHANARGIGLLEQFDYPAAAREFDEAVRLDPDWLPARINLGIALLNTNEPENLNRAIEVFHQVLVKAPENPYAHYCLGIIYLYQNHRDEAAMQFEAVTRIDPTDAYAWYNRGLTHPDKDNSPEAKQFFRKALELNPSLNAARYALAQNRFEYDAEKSKALLAQHKALMDANWESEYRLVYSEMGRYAEAIGRPPAAKPVIGPLPVFERDQRFHVDLAAGTRWAKDEDLGAGVLGDLRRALRARFGGTVVRLDYNGDGKPDLLLLSAVVRGGAVRNVLLRNDGGGRFTDVTMEAGLDDAPASFGCSVADTSNGGTPDLLLTGPEGLRFYRNADGKRFEDRTVDAGFGKQAGVFLGSCWIDIDQDGDVDLLAARYAATPEAALARLKGRAEGEAGGLLLFLNVGVAPPNDPDGKPHRLTSRFRLANGPEDLLVRGSVVGFTASDLDNDRAVDLMVFGDGQAPLTLLNDRLLRFHRDAGIKAPVQDWNGGLVFDANHDEQSDLLLLPVGAKPLLLLSRRDTPGEGTSDRFAVGATDSPPLRQAQAVDLDLDGWTDIVGLSTAGEPVLLQNDGTGRLVHRRGALNPGPIPADVIAVTVLDMDGAGAPDVLLWSAAAGPQVWHNLGNGNHGLRLALSGRRDKGAHLRTNADGIGARAEAYAGLLRTGVENTTLEAGLSQSRLPLVLGLGRAAMADVVRIRWPDGVPQAELDRPAGEVMRIAETNRKGTSCPVLFTWDGTRFSFVTDFLGAGSLGEMGPDGAIRPPRPEESVKIEPAQLQPRAGRYVLKIAEPMDEVVYLDHLALDVIDHPAAIAVFPDERFADSGPPPTQDLLVLGTPLFPLRATDHRGTDVTAILRERDGKMVSGFAPRSWLGYAEEHFVEMDFGDQLAKMKGDARLYLVLAGWTDYAYPESIYAATQAGVPMIAPLLERLGPDGKWQPLGDIGFPAGLPRVMTVEVPALVGAKQCRLRLRTNLQISWDQVYLAQLVETAAPGAEGRVKVRRLEVERASLSHRGVLREIAPLNGGPIEYDAESTESVAVTRWQGRLTRLGDVTELLRQADDRLVICGPGDEIAVEFDARRLPALPPGHVRSFVLRTRGYCKDASPFTSSGGHVGPLPYAAMKNYPHGASGVPYAEAESDRRLWHTRPAGR